MRHQAQQANDNRQRCLHITHTQRCRVSQFGCRLSSLIVRLATSFLAATRCALLCSLVVP